MKRHFSLILFVWLCNVVPVFGENPEKLLLVGGLRINTPDNVEPFLTVFGNALAALGQIDGRNIHIELRLAEGHAERFPELARELVREKASVIVASGDAAVRAAQQATHTIPIVAIVDDIVASGLINSSAKPGGNTTGVSILASELDAKRLEILKQIVLSGGRFAVIRDATSTAAQPELLADAARLLGIQLQIIDVRSPADFAPAFASLRAGGAEAVLILSSPLLSGFRKELCGLSVAYKTAAIGQFREMSEAGCLVSYGIRVSDAYVIAADLTNKMLTGARPGETPAQQPTKFELVINLQTAKALDLTVPPSVVIRADEVIE
jgi:putative tryptophan/tyrosine transport system substrate-binding protein